MARRYTKKQAKNAVRACRSKLLLMYSSDYITRKEWLDTDGNLERILRKLMK